MPFTTARIVARTKLFYAAGADPSQDRPAHVRAGSGIVPVDTPKGRRLLVVQDDANFLALVDPVTKKADSIALPAAAGGRRTFDEASGTKKLKLDLECVTVIDNVVFAFGSGSSDKRERVVVARVDREPPEVSVVDAGALYTAFRTHAVMSHAVAPSKNTHAVNTSGEGERVDAAELNLEGVAVAGDLVTFFQRGNGVGAIDATFDVDKRALVPFLLGSGPTPHVLRAKRWNLGTVDAAKSGIEGVAGNVRLTFTDACHANGVTYVIAAAEASPNAIDDGVVVGCAFGSLGGGDLKPILDEQGKPFVGKPEGIAIEGNRAWIVVDKDDPSAPCELLEVELS